MMNVFAPLALVALIAGLAGALIWAIDPFLLRQPKDRP